MKNLKHLRPVVLQAFEALEFWNTWNTYLVILECDLSLKEKIDVSPIHSPQVYIVLFLVHLFQLSHPSNGQQMLGLTTCGIVWVIKKSCTMVFEHTEFFD